uniref:Uncharacterized protein n=1 Tax=viral metagenome TaxID=1070528 RepID=A0A6C0I2I6_9ZZZZ
MSRRSLDPICDIDHYGSVKKIPTILGEKEQTCATNDKGNTYKWFNTHRLLGKNIIQKAEDAKNKRIIERIRIEKQILKEYYEKLEPKYNALFEMIEEYKSDITNSMIESYNKGELLQTQTLSGAGKEKLSDTHISKLQNAYKEILETKKELTEKESIIKNIHPYYKDIDDESISILQTKLRKYKSDVLKDFIQNLSIYNPNYTPKTPLREFNEIPNHIGYDFLFLGRNNTKNYFGYPSEIYKNILYKVFDLDDYDFYASKAADAFKRYKHIILEGKKHTGMLGGKTKKKRCKKGSRRNKQTNRCKRTNRTR